MTGAAFIPLLAIFGYIIFHYTGKPWKVQEATCLACGTPIGASWVEESRIGYVNPDGSLVCEFCYRTWHEHPIEVDWIK